MKDMRYVLNSTTAISAAIGAITHLPLDDKDHLYEVIIRHHKSSRSSQQNALYWKWLTELSLTDINEHAGHEKEWWHDEFKVRYAVPILERDEGIDFSEIRSLYLSATPSQKMRLKKLLADSIHTPDLNVSQMSEYMDEINRWATGQGILLTQPEEL